MEPYIDQNTKLRAEATSKFDKDFFKLLNNSLFGKSLENVRKRKEIQLVTTESKAIKLTSKPEYTGYREFHDALYAVSLKKKKICMDKPIFIGMAILELSKLLMLEFFYDYFKVKYPDCRMLYTDTDSMIIDVKTDDLYADLKTETEHYDFSDYPKDHPLYNVSNIKKPGIMKDELNGTPIIEYVGLRSKMYSIKFPSADASAASMSKAKGTDKNAIRNGDIRHEDYIHALEGTKNIPDYPNISIRSNNHKLGIVCQHKKSLAVGDTKRIFQSKEKSLALGHYSTRLSL